MTGRPANGIDTTVPHSARVWNVFLNGKDNFDSDRQLAAKIIEAFPDILPIARESRRFLSRAVAYLAGEEGIGQFLDIGTGLPTADNTHEVAQRVNPAARVAYVDNDPLVLAHARALLTTGPAGRTDYIDADVRDPDAILRAAATTLDFARPVGLMMLGILGNVEDHDEARSIVDRLVAALVPGSFLVVNDGTNVVNPAARNKATRLSKEHGAPYIARHPDQIAAYFTGLDLVEPGIVSTSRWRPDDTTDGEPALVDVYSGVARVR